MSHRPSTVLVVGATGSIGRYAVAEALRQGYAVRASKPWTAAGHISRS
ncbi:hypothetical protein [Arthrobacter sp. NicSoilB8]|nr:hypothetical protein [Arthrobacter sp. NicSoilB8]BCW70990.1 hypothetical protein NicSoilB8_20340 [Arthrobacter sp. NicSoilB8]